MLKDYLTEKSAQLGPVIEKYLASENKELQEMLMHTSRAGGKRIRPCLLLLACEAVGGEPDKVLPAAASVELLHTFTLIHDDIVDKDTTRRGKPTVHALWGVDMGIIIGDAIYSKAFESLIDLRQTMPSEKILDAFAVLNWANAQIHDGQMLDMLFEERNSVLEEEYIDMVAKKTAVLLEASMKMGAILGNGSDDEVDALARFGHNIGVAFQIKDDILDLTAKEGELGKPLASDIRAGKKSIIVIHALNNNDTEKRKEVEQILKSKEADIKEILKLLDGTGSIKYAEDLLGSLIDDAKNSLTALKDSDSKELLIELADYIIERRY